MLIEAFAIWPNKGQAKLAIAGSNLTGVDNQTSATVPPAPLPPTFAPVGTVSGITAEPATGDDETTEEDPAAAASMDQDAATEEERITENDATEDTPSSGTDDDA